ncbi:conserved hypothetical protein [Uncinocarpus reesii 1704]|uniref:Sucrase/ferredoxin-like family protein n=1 Tax=Uncinocarpus reesii (strain UAMH 1704) TaxID=336963 RepID=C4JS57_UNCRE|nr:uncharacterized protein UREG_05296 [Uncinocarpus reesii 1704]EEP80454.1 conserved hypothetical protein [Uncinocarpus reesii 1704]
MASLLRRGLDYLSPSASPAPSPQIPNFEAGDDPKPPKPIAQFTTASTPTTLFTLVDKAVDGEDCDHDCASCTIKYPAKFSIDYDDELYGHVKGWMTHILVATGKTDWVRDVADEKGSVMEAIGKGGISPSSGPMKLSASNMPVPDEYYHHPEGEQPTTVLLLPAFTIIDHVTPALVPDLIKHFVDLAPTTTSPLTGTPQKAEREEPTELAIPDSNAADPSSLDLTQLTQSLPTSLHSRPCPHAAVILLCSQKTRDARCGQSAPLLRREFERHLRPLVYRRRDFEWFKRQNHDSEKECEASKTGTGQNEGAAQGIWLARVRPEDCEGIVKFTVLQGKVVKPGLQLRGGFDREKGLISW